MRNRIKGFTLIELLVVIGIVGILLSITLVAINPARQFRIANDAARQSGINTLSSAVAQLIIDNKGVVPPAISALSSNQYYSLWSSNASTNGGAVLSGVRSLCSYLTGQASLNTTVGTQTYISKLPIDPASGYIYTDCNSFDLGYSMKIQNARVYVTARTEEPVGTIEVSR